MTTQRRRKGKDVIRVNDILVFASLYSGAQWSRDKPDPVEQPISITVSIFYDISGAARGDDLTQSLNYAVVSKKIRASVGGSKSFQCLQHFARHLSHALAEALEAVVEGLDIHIQVTQLRAPLHVKQVSVDYLARFSGTTPLASDVTLSVVDLVCPAIIGVNAAEREEKQDIIVNLTIKSSEQGLEDDEWVDIRDITRSLYQAISTTDFQTLEALTSFVASNTLSSLSSFNPSPLVSVRIAKPSALVFAASSEVEIHRTREDYLASSKITAPVHADRHIAAIAFGSNLGDSIRNIEYALRLLEVPSEDLYQGQSLEDQVAVIDTSFLYETQPMYITDQPSFINGACMIETNLDQNVLLSLLKDIEQKVGRVPSERNGPRAVDLDIIFYDDLMYDNRQSKDDPVDGDGVLVIPHPRLQEREFVLRPLCDIVPDHVHPVLKKTVETLLQDVITTSSSTSPMKKIIPFPRGHISIPHIVNPLDFGHVPSAGTTWKFTSAGPNVTKVMATINATPDSFSDGGDNYTISTALSYARNAVDNGASIIDIGGYSTRPGADFVSVQEETDRVSRLIRALRGEVPKAEGHALPTSSCSVQHIPISIDTFRWEVAEKAIQSGATCINDVYAFTGPDSWPMPTDEDAQAQLEKQISSMKDVARRFMTPVVLMHSRGDAGKNKDYTTFNYAKAGSRGAVVEGVRVELGEKVDRIVKGKGGLRRWLVIVDPGVGFSKTLEGNAEILRNARAIVADTPVGSNPTYRNPLRGFPLLIGTSRKSFLGAILAQEPVGRETTAKERTFATAAAVSCAVQQDALIVRVHDVQEMMDVVKVSEMLRN